VTRTYLRQFNLHKTNAANEELVISLKNGREAQERKPIYRLLHHYNSLSNKMDNSLLAVRDINHKYIVVDRRKQDEKGSPA
jgi:hydroxypyruvate isomerase